MSNAEKIITIVGGTGFVGRAVVAHLAKEGYRIRIIARNPNAALHLKTAGDVGQITLESANLAKPESLVGKLAGSFAVINLVGVLFEKGGQKFATLQAQGSERLAKMAAAAGVSRYIHMSALGVDKASGSEYARTKLMGEKGVLAAFPSATILRPSVIFGPDDNFFNQFAAMASLSPFLPLIGGGSTKFQPVYVGDVAEVVALALSRDDLAGQILELGGPKTYSFKQILEYVNVLVPCKSSSVFAPFRFYFPMPFGLASAVGFIGEFAPRPPITRDQVKLLKYDNVVSANAKGLDYLRIEATAVETIVPEYLARFNPKKVA